MTNEDLKKQLKTYIDEKFVELDDRYKRKEDCEHDRQDTKDEISRLTTDFAVIKTELRWLVALTSIITTSVVGYVVSLIFRG